MRKLNSSRRWGAPLLGMAVLAGLILGLTPADTYSESAKLGGEVRFLAHVSTDKPIYKHGDTVYFRTVLLDAFKRTPTAGHTGAQLTIKSPKGATVADSHFNLADSTGGASWKVPSNMAGGEYTAVVSFPNHGHAPAERKFDIRAYRAPRLRTQMEFVRKAYGPGDTVSAVLHTLRAEGGVPTDAKITAVARVDGAEIWRGGASIDDQGFSAVSFSLPATIKEGVGSLTLVIEDGGVIESASKTLPILLQRIPVTFCPEGGDLVAGLDCGLYFEAKTPWGDPADISGEIVDAKGAKVVDFTTVHEGRGRVTFKPVAGAQYFAKITEPAGITKLEPLPEVQKQGVSLRADEPVFAADAGLDFKVSATKAGKYKLVLSHRERNLAERELELKAGVNQSTYLMPEGEADGVFRATLYDTDGKPAAERLVFRRPLHDLRIEVTANPQDAVPGDKVELTIRTTKANGEPIAATVGLTVTDDSVLEMIERRKQAPRLMVMALLENEVDSIEDAHIYFSDDAKAPVGIDLLLGTQGWRRFAHLTPEQFMAKHGDKAKRVLAFKEPERRPGWGGDEGGGAGGPRGLPRPAGGVPPAQGPEPENAPQEDAEDKPAANEEQAEEKAPVRRVVEDPADEPMERDVAGRRRDIEQRRALVTIREYSHTLREGRQAGDRRDFTETLYWNAGLKTDDKGLAKVSFFLSDSVTSFRVMADGFTAAGGLGQGDTYIKARQPFYLEPKLPLEVTAGDVIMLPVSLVNSTGGGMKVVLSAEAGEGISIPADFAGDLDLKADERGRLFLPVTVAHHNGKVSLSLAGKAGAFSDRVTREIGVRPMGFPISYSIGGMLGKPQATTIVIPDDVRRSSITTSAKVYTTPAANLTQAVEALVREPYG